MIGTRKYGLPSASKKKTKVEEEKPVESAEVQNYEDDALYDQDELYDDYETGDYVEAPVEEYVPAQNEDDYYFEEQEEPVNRIEPSKAFVMPPAPLQPVQARDDLFDEVEKAVGDGMVLEPLEEKVERERNERDESEPFNSPPGYVWRAEEGTRIPFLSRKFLMNLIGIGDAGERFVKRPGGEEEEEEGKLMSVMNPFESQAGLDQKMSEKRRMEKLTKVLDENAKKNAAMSEEEDEDTEQGESQDFKWSDLGVSKEIESDTPGWMFWHGDRWNHWWHGYETPSSWFFGYPAQWLYRFVHLLAPETYDSFKYKPEYGQVDWAYAPYKAWYRIWWVLSHPCLGQIIFNCILITPFSLIPQIRRRLKIIRYRIELKRTVLTSVWDHLPILLRRFRWKTWRKKRRRYRIWTAVLTFVFANNCWDLYGKHDLMPNEDFWEKNYIGKFIGVQTSAGDLEKIKRPAGMDGVQAPIGGNGLGISLPGLSQGNAPSATPTTFKSSSYSLPNKKAIREYLAEKEELTQKRSQHREEVFGTPDQQQEDWTLARQTEIQARQEQIEARASAAAALRRAAEESKKRL